MIQQLRAPFFILICVFAVVGTHQANAQDSYVTLWASGLGTTNKVSAATLILKTNETAHLVSWPQIKFRFSFLNVASGMRSIMFERKPEIEVEQKTNRITEHGALPIPPVVVVGPATLKLSVVGNETMFCTFRVVHGNSSVIQSRDN